ncbi:MAG: hypothetical protein ACYDGY_10595 [Acidimicrobiales bacterium]
MNIPETYLLTYDEDNTPIAVPNLSISLSTSGITVAKPDGTPAAMLDWQAVSNVSGVERVQAPDGRPAVLLEATASSKAHHFIVPTQDPDGFISQIAAFAPLCQAKRKGKAGGLASKKISPLGAGIAIVLIAAIVAVLLLMSAGVIRP